MSHFFTGSKPLSKEIHGELIAVNRSEKLTYKCQAKKILSPTVRMIADTADDLTIQLTLENLRNKSNLFVRKWHSAQITKRGLR